MRNTKLKVFLDTNVLMDLIFSRDPYCQDATTIFWMAEQKKIELQISLLSFVNSVYVSKRYGISANDIKRTFSSLLDFVEVPDCGKAELMHALRSPMNDFEDATQVAAALTGIAEVIVSRNVKDFAGAPIRVLSPHEFLTEYSFLMREE